LGGDEVTNGPYESVLMKDGRALLSLSSREVTHPGENRQSPRWHPDLDFHPCNGEHELHLCGPHTQVLCAVLGFGLWTLQFFEA
jgi:hypothetical protein